MGMLPAGSTEGSTSKKTKKTKKAKKVVEPKSEKFAGRSILKDITLPSRGLLYGEECPDGKIQVAAFTTREEKLFASQGMGAEDKVTHALKNCA